MVLIRNNLRKSFVDTEVHGQLKKRVNDVEGKVGRLPSHEEWTKLGERVGVVEVKVGSTEAALSGIRDGIDKVERMVGLLVKHQLDQKGSQ
jgi:hypothetical protein